MTTILNRAKSASLASFRFASPKALLRVEYLMDPMPDDRALANFAAFAQQYHPNVLSITQDLSALEAHYSE